MTAEELWERYTELAMEQPVDLEEFCRMAASGELGEAVDPSALAGFLRRVEAMMLANIETKLQEAPHLQPMRDEAVERTQQIIARLMDRYGRPQGPR